MARAVQSFPPGAGSEQQNRAPKDPRLQIQPSPGEARVVAEWPADDVPRVPDHKLLRCIGHGAYGEVWIARNVMGNYRAIKILQREHLGRERPFQREYEGLLRFEPVSRAHPNLMQVLHVGRRNGYFYYVTELADNANAPEPATEGTAGRSSRDPANTGQETEVKTLPAPEPFPVASYVPRTLREDLDRRKRIPVKECVGIGMALVAALRHLHEKGLVHRDVKPSNVIFVHGVPKLADVGLVAAAGDSRSIVGTEGYLPPEGPGNPQADLYALGKLLYEISTGMDCGRFPRLPPNLDQLPDATELLEFNEILLKACTKETARRYCRAEELLADLALLERGDSVKRLRRLERHHALYKRIGAGVLAVGILASAAWWQTWRTNRITGRHLAQWHVNEGTRHLGEGNYAAALPYFAGALELDAADGSREMLHRARIAQVLQRCPVPVACFSAPKTKILAADLNPASTVLATAHDDGFVRLWDTRSEKLLQQLRHGFPVVLCQFLTNGTHLLTLTLGQLHVWDLLKPDAPRFSFDQAVEMNSDLYSVGMNARLGTVYLSKSRYCFAKIHELNHAFENLTLCLRLVGNGETLAVQYEVRRTAPANVVLCRGEFRDSPGADRFAEGRDDPAAPLWGKVGLGLDNGSTGDKRGDRGEVLWGAVRARGYRSGQPPAPWRVVDDFDQGLLTNWVNLAPLDSSNTCKVENGRLVLSSRNLPLAQLGWMGTYRQELFEISSSHTLEIEADLVAARAPHPMAGVSLIRPRLDPFTAPDRPFIVQNRCFILSRWDYSILVRDLEDASSASAEGSGRSVPRCFTHPFPIRQGDVDPAGRYLAIAEPSDQGDLEDRLAVWELQTTRKLTLAIPKDLQATGVRFSPDGHLLAVSHRDGLALIRTTDWQWARTVGKGAFFSQPLFSPGGWRLAAVRNRRELVVWDLNDFDEPLATFKCGSDLRRIVFSPDGRYLASSAANETVRVWDAAKAEPFAPPLPGTLARFSPDGTLLVVIGPESAAWLWDLTRVADDPLLVPAVRGEENLASSGDGAITAEINDHGITLTTPAGRHSLSLPVPTRLYRVRFSSDDRFLIAESPQLQAWIWDVRSRTLLGPPPSLHYEAALESPSALPLPLAAQAKPILSGLAALLGQQQPDGHGGMIPITEAARVRLFRELRRSQPTEFQPEEPNQTRWHEQQAKAAELAMDWDAAVFHWGQIQNVEARFRAPKSAACIERHLAYARQAADAVRQQAVRGRTRWSVILPRQPWVPADMLDLGRFYTTPLGEGHRSFRELGSGVRCLGGTDFDVRGIIDLKRTNQVVIPLGRVCRRIHFLNAASQTCFPREPAGTYTVKYANATSASITPLNPEHVPPYAYDRFHEVAALSRTNASLGLRATLVWSGAAQGPDQRRQLVYLTRTTWELPAAHQGDSVESLQLRAGPAGSAPLIFAITVE